MRWVRFDDNGRIGHGRIDGEHIVEIAGDFFGARTETGKRLALAGVRLLPPVIPPTFYAAGVNYRAHFKTAAEKAGKPVQYPAQCDIGYRAVNALTAPGDAVVIPRDSAGKIQFEGELVVVIGKKVKHLTPADAMDCIFGYTIGNDVSERAWQASDRTNWRGKNTDTFKPMGPWIETDVDLDAMQTVIRLNGNEVSRFGTATMLFGIVEALVTMTRYLTLVPGDVVWMGTDDPTLDMVAGDVVEVELSGIGVLRNPIVAEPAA